MKRKHGRHLTHAEAVKYGKMGGSPILLAWAKKHPVHGYKVSKGRNGRDRD